MFRFIVAIDIEEEDLQSAYKILRSIMNNTKSSKMEWETTDEAYDETGNLIDTNILSETICKEIDLANQGWLDLVNSIEIK